MTETENEADSGASRSNAGLGACRHEQWECVGGGAGNASVGGVYLHRDRCCACGVLSFRRDDNGARRIDGGDGKWEAPNAQ